MTKVITTLHYNRPQYTRRMLECLAAADGIEDYTVVAYVHEGGSRDVVQLLKDFSAARTTHVVTENLGVAHLNPDQRLTRATHRALELGFTLGDYVIHLEDDILVARDALRFFAYARQFEREPDCLSVTGYSKYRPELDTDTLDRHAVARLAWFHPWGWATWKSRWETLINPRWGEDHWDEHLSCAARQHRYEIFPQMARTLNVGAMQGVNVPGPIWHHEHQFNGRWFVDNAPLPAGSFWDPGDPIIRPD